jgi:hypothetical protein
MHKAECEEYGGTFDVDGRGSSAGGEREVDLYLTKRVQAPCWQRQIPAYESWRGRFR